MEDLIHHFKLFAEGLPRARGQKLCRRQASGGEFGIYLVIDSANKPYRLIRALSCPYLAAADN